MVKSGYRNQPPAIGALEFTARMTTERKVRLIFELLRNLVSFCFYLLTNREQVEAMRQRLENRESKRGASRPAGRIVQRYSVFLWNYVIV